MRTRGTVEMAGRSRATRLIASRIAGTDVIARTSASLRSRACFLATASSSEADWNADIADVGGKRDVARAGGASLLPGTKFFSVDIGLF
jgi:hypothetical protein